MVFIFILHKSFNLSINAQNIRHPFPSINTLHQAQRHFSKLIFIVIIISSSLIRIFIYLFIEDCQHFTNSKMHNFFHILISLVSECAFQSTLSWNCYQSNDKYSIVVLLYIFGNIKKGLSCKSVQWVSSSWINTLGTMIKSFRKCYRSWTMIMKTVKRIFCGKISNSMSLILNSKWF